MLQITDKLFITERMQNKYV